MAIIPFNKAGFSNILNKSSWDDYGSVVGLTSILSGLISLLLAEQPVKREPLSRPSIELAVVVY